MLIASYLPTTFCDYPGKVAAIIFTRGCNFRCPWCHNKHLIDFTDVSCFDAAAIIAEVSERCRAGMLDGLVITGGEPTAQADLLDFLRECKAAGIPVKLDTNGSRPDVLRACFAEGLVAFVAMDVKAPLGKYDLLCGVAVDVGAIRKSIALIAASGVPHQFRTTVVPELLNEGDVEKIKGMLPEGEEVVLQAYRPVSG